MLTVSTTPAPQFLNSVNVICMLISQSLHVESNTQLAYYIMLEAGFTIVAVNLPSLWYFTAGITPERA